MEVKAKVGDISKYNQINNYPLLMGHFDGVIVRIGYRGYSAGVIKEDALFQRHMDGLIKAAIPYGFYFMSQAVTESESMAEAEYCYEMTRLYPQPAYPIYYDSELSNNKGNGRADNLSKADRTQIAKAFCKRMQELGRIAGVYASKSWFKDRLNVQELADYSIWVAQYNTTCSYMLTDYDMWQHTSNYIIPGITSRFDRSLCYTDFDIKKEISNNRTGNIKLKEGIYAYSLKCDGEKTFVIGDKVSNFKLREFRCKDGSDEILIDSILVRILQNVRSHFGKPVSITSAYRTASHNKSVSGATSSYHVEGMAADFTVSGISNRTVAQYMENIGINGIGLYDYTGGFVHVDTRARKYYWQQDKRNSKYYGVSTFRTIAVYLVKDQTVATVRYNDRNEFVKLLQSELGLNPDGIFGAKTEEAVREFQETHGLAVDGVVGINTWSVIL